MTITVPKPLVVLFWVALAIGAVWLAREEGPALRRYIKFETM